MKLVRNNAKNCYNLSTIGDQSIVDWSGSNATEIISVMPYPNIPDLFYKEWDQNNYQWCGPMLLYLEYLSRFSNVK